MTFELDIWLNGSTCLCLRQTHRSRS